MGVFSSLACPLIYYSGGKCVPTLGLIRPLVKALHRPPHEVLEVQSSHSEQRRHLKNIFFL